jgi:nitrite reductase/ring-hydroxylating ferredoxin subunit
MGSIPVCRLSEVVQGELLSVEVCSDNLIVYQGTDGTVRVASAHCPHVGTHLGKNSTVSGGVVTCPLHHYRFNLEDGSCGNQKKLRLRFFAVRVREGLLWVDREADFVEAAPGSPEEGAAIPAAGQAAVLTCSFTLRGSQFQRLLPAFSSGGDHEAGLHVASPYLAFSHLKIHLAPVDGVEVRVFVVAFLGAGASLAAQPLQRLERSAPGRLASGSALQALLRPPALVALGRLTPSPTPLRREAARAGEGRYLPQGRFMNDWMFVGMARDIGPEPTIVERMGRRVKLQRRADGSIDVTSADGTHRYPHKVDPNYGVVHAYFNVDDASPPWTLPDFDFDDRYQVYDSFHSTSRCAVEDVHGTVLDWTHLTGYHQYEKTRLLEKFVGDYSIGCTYITASKKFLKYWRLGDIENTNKVTIHGLCTLDFHFTGYLSKEIYFNLKLLSMYYISEGQSQQTIIASWRKDLVNATPLFERVVYPPFKRFSYEVGRLDLVTETSSIYKYKRLLREPRVSTPFPYLALGEYAKKFYPPEVPVGPREEIASPPA